LIHLLRKAAYKHGYLIITAAWLYTLSFIFINYWSYHASPQKVKALLEDRLEQRENQFSGIISDTALLFHLTSDTLIVKEPPIGDIGLFIYGRDARNTHLELLYWNTNKIYIDPPDIGRNDGNYFVNNRNGDFELIKRKVFLRGKAFSVIGMVPVRWSYFIENKYLHTDFAGYKGLQEQYEISKDSSSIPVMVNGGQELFRIKLKSGKSFIAYDSFTIILRVLAILLLLIFLHSIALELVIHDRFRNGFLFLLITVVFLRFLTYQFPFPFDFSKLPLFDPSIYASNFLHPSLGDLFVNAILLFWLVGFYKNSNDYRPWFGKKLPGNISPYSSLVALTVICFVLAGIIISLVKDGKISFDVTNFFSLTVYSVVSFILLCFLVLSFFYFSQVFLKPVISHQMAFYQQCITIALCGFVYLLLFIPTEQNPVYLWVLFWLLLYVALLNLRKTDIDVSLQQSPFFIFWVMFFALSIASMVIVQNRQVEFIQRERMAEKLALQNDPSGENLLNIAATGFDDQFLSDNFPRFLKNEYTNKFIKDSLISQNFSGYLNKYDTRIYTFDSLYHPLFNEDSLNYASIKTIILNQAKPTDIADLYGYENPSEGFSYYYQKTIRKAGLTEGYLFVIIKSKRYKSEALYPELFNQVRDISTDLNTNYAYAVYNKGRMINHFNTYNFPAQITGNKVGDFEFSHKQAGDYSELWYNSGANKQVLVVKRNTWLIEAVTLFAYLFCSFLCILLLFHLGNYVLRARFKWKELLEMLRLSIRSQIQATIIFLSVFSFVVIGIATISFFILRFNQNNEERLTKSIQVMANEINSKMHLFLAYDDDIANNPRGLNELEKTIADISDLHNVDINYYDLQGTLVISTQPYIYNKHLLSEKMEPNAYQQLQKAHSIRYLQSEKIGSFEYLSIYVPLTDERGNSYAYLNIPYLNSQSELNQEISGFLATLINLNAFIFLIAGAIAFFLTSRITQSFSLIGKKMQEMHLGKVNEAIQWNRNDEIGMLVEEYNKMVQKLELSAQALAKSEREGAWREMARQVAHEIKNPLTPMKLSIQYLQNAIQKGAPNVKELSENMASTLIEQIDQLSKIAGDFSQFANIGNARMERFDITEVLSSIIQLHSANPRIHIDWEKEAGTYEMLSDRVQMNRLFTNLLLNAIEAKNQTEDLVQIIIQQRLENGKVRISVKDYSGGIPAAMKANIFTPNFTTKTSGTGLGLAICKGIVEQANGRIWFETEEGVGSEFFIELPLASSL
jgi:signal transduction histidine kinase